MTCVDCERGQAAIPLIVFGTVVGLGGGVAAYNYKYHNDFYKTYCENNKERLYMQMNQGTIVVSERKPSDECLKLSQNNQSVRLTTS